MAYFYRKGNTWHLIVSRNGVRKDVNLGPDYQKAKLLRASIEQAWQNDSFKKQLAQSLLGMGLLEPSCSAIAPALQQDVGWDEPVGRLMAYLKKIKRAERTVWLAQMSLDNLRNALGAKSLSEVTTQKVDDWTAGLLSQKRKNDPRGEKTLSSSTVSVLFRACRACFERFRRWKIIKENPFADAEKPVVELTLPRPFTDKEFRLLLAACNAPLARCVRILRHSGMRPDEFLHLTWKRARLGKNPVIAIEKDGIWIPKAHTERLIPCSSDLVQALGTPGETEDLACGKNDRGYTVGKNWLERSFGRALRRAGLKGRGFVVYSLRDTYATELALNGFEAHAIAARLGHRNLQTSMRYVSMASVLKNTQGNGRNGRKNR